MDDDAKGTVNQNFNSHSRICYQNDLDGIWNFAYFFLNNVNQAGLIIQLHFAYTMNKNNTLKIDFKSLYKEQKIFASKGNFR